VNFDCIDCGATIDGDDLGSLGDAFLVHVRSVHADWPFPDQAVRNVGEATQRLTGSTERLAEIGTVEVHPVTDDRIDDWLAFFDHDAFVGRPENAACYCFEPHDPELGPRADFPHWSEVRATMVERLRDGSTFGYLAYVDGRPAGWLNASRRCDYSELGFGAPEGGDDVVGLSCFVIAPPYRRHGVAGALLDRATADAAGRGARAVEAWPFLMPDDEVGDRGFRGPSALYEERGFATVERRRRDSVVRRDVG
jgi:GNAT superfamily N-acetyltransferase